MTDEQRLNDDRLKFIAAAHEDNYFNRDSQMIQDLLDHIAALESELANARASRNALEVTNLLLRGQVERLKSAVAAADALDEEETDGR